MMKRIGLSATAIAISLTGAALADPKDEACELMSYIAIGDMSGARTYWETLITHWDEEQREAGTNNIFTPLQNLTLTGLAMYRTLVLDGIAEEFLAVSGFPNGGQIYFRIFFEKWGDKMRLVNFRYQQDYEKIAEPAFAQTPAVVPCAS